MQSLWQVSVRVCVCGWCVFLGTWMKTWLIQLIHEKKSTEDRSAMKNVLFYCKVLLNINISLPITSPASPKGAWLTKCCWCLQMFLQVRPSGSSHEEAHLERDERPTQPKGEEMKTKQTQANETKAISRPVSWWNCPRAEWRECVPAKACRFAPYWNPVPAGPLFGERRSEGCLLQREKQIHG